MAKIQLNILKIMSYIIHHVSCITYHESELRRKTSRHDWSSYKALKKFRTWIGFEPMTSAMCRHVFLPNQITTRTLASIPKFADWVRRSVSQNHALTTPTGLAIVNCLAIFSHLVLSPCWKKMCFHFIRLIFINEFQSLFANKTVSWLNLKLYLSTGS